MARDGLDATKLDDHGKALICLGFLSAAPLIGNQPGPRSHHHQVVVGPCLSARPPGGARAPARARPTPRGGDRARARPCSPSRSARYASAGVSGRGYFPRHGGWGTGQGAGAGAAHQVVRGCGR